MVLGSALKSHTQVVCPQIYTQSVPQFPVVRRTRTSSFSETNIIFLDCQCLQVCVCVCMCVHMWHWSACTCMYVCTHAYVQVQINMQALCVCTLKKIGSSKYKKEKNISQWMSVPSSEIIIRVLTDWALDHIKMWCGTITLWLDFLKILNYVPKER